MKIIKFTLVLLIFIATYYINYNEFVNIPLKYLTIWSIINFIIGLVLPFLIYTFSLSNKNLKESFIGLDNKYINPKKSAFFIGVVMLAIGLGLLNNNSIDIVIITFLSLGFGSILSQFLYSRT